MTNVSVRSALPADIDAVLELWTVAAENAARPADTPSAVDALIRRDPDALRLACKGRLLVGSLIGGWDGWRLHLYRLAVHPGHRRQGIGGLLLDDAESRHVANGVTRVDAMVLDGNFVAEALWSVRGYQRQQEWSRWVKPMG